MDRTGQVGRGRDTPMETYQPPKELLSEEDLVEPQGELRDRIDAEPLELPERILRNLTTPNSKWRVQDKIMAATYYMILGSYQKAAEHMKASGRPVPKSAIVYWRNYTSWWKPLTEQIRRAKSDEFDALCTQVIHSGLDALKDRIQSGEYRLQGVDKDGNPNIVRVPMAARDLSIVTGTMYDKRALGRGEATTRAQRDPEGALEKIAKFCEEMTKDKPIEAKKIETEYWDEKEETEEKAR